MLTIEQQEDWRCVFRVGIAPFVSDEALLRTAAALRELAPRLCWGVTTEPLYLDPGNCEQACPLADLGWGGQPMPVREVYQRFGALCDLCARATGSVLAIRSCIDGWDMGDLTPEAWAEEMEAAVSRRAGKGVGA